MRRPGRVAVIGATGLVGSALVRRFVVDGWEVTAICRSERSAARVAAALRGTRLVTLSDLLDGEQVCNLFRECRPHVVVHCIGMLSGGSPCAARAYADANITAIAVTLDACARAEVGRTIVLGSGFEYAPSSDPLDEGSPTGPTTLYSATKAAGSLVVRYFRSVASLDVCVARPFSLYGPRGRPRSFVPYLITSALSGRPIQMSAGTQVRDYLHVEDLADGLVRLAGHEGVLPEALNFAGADEQSLLDIAMLVVELAGPTVPVRTGARPANPGDRPVFLGDSRRAFEVLGWRPTQDLRSGLASTIDWYREHRDFWETWR